MDAIKSLNSMSSISMTSSKSPKAISHSSSENTKQLVTELKNDTFQKNGHKIEVVIPQKAFVPLGFDVNYEKKGFLSDNYAMNGGIYNVEIKNSLFSGRRVVGEIGKKNVNLKIVGSAWNSNKCSLTGQIDGKNINLNFAKVKNGGYMLTGEIDEKIKNFIPALTLLASHKVSYNKEAETMTMMAASL